MDAVVKQLTEVLYPTERDVAVRLLELVERYKPAIARQRERFSDAVGDFPLASDDAILITYGDTFRGDDGAPLRYLFRFLDESCEGALSGVHILPFSPYSSDDGFSVIDYREIDPNLGTWEDVEAIADEFRLMADLVLNHCSAQGPWFQRFLKREEPYSGYFITADPEGDYSMVVRPRALPLLSPFDTAAGTKHVWTTFSADQVDLNWSNARVMLEMVEIFLSYMAHGAQVVRLDAIAYLWKEIGHPSIHHPHTHRMVKLFRRVMELVDPHGILITETNVPHDENVSYFGDGDEAHMVYNFSLPPLLLDAVARGDAGHLSRWAAELEDPGPGASYFNFCASHDGIGLTPTHGILSDEERDQLIATVLERGGRVSYKATASGKIPYEMNVNYFSASADPNLPDAQRAGVFLATQAVMLAMAGVPGIYVHSLIGSQNWEAGVEETGMNRTINREKIDFEAVKAELEREGSVRNLVFEGYKRLLRARARATAFHPRSPQRVVDTDRRLFVLARGPYIDGEAREGEHDSDEARRGGAVLAIHNLSGDIVEFRDRRDRYPWRDDGVMRDLVSDDLVYPVSDGELFSLELEPYEVMWLQF